MLRHAANLHPSYHALVGTPYTLNSFSMLRRHHINSPRPGCFPPGYSAAHMISRDTRRANLLSKKAFLRPTTQSFPRSPFVLKRTPRLASDSRMGFHENQRCITSHNHSDLGLEIRSMVIAPCQRLHGFPCGHAVPLYSAPSNSNPLPSI
ncbi:hypothetical protein BDV95DRAFT_172039 [Massariosphaeria phaeospora]|uniref:Uncharacterized protein n=1 Tax=Massariosphaeria phaeospora TaxID=100035 RepID=A0A7C8M4M8_9PLEO|nr:hypothetical protein BDV95DRAFT_294397 [Massariosphaeria phaeospora]KAF2867661.1 hypothetical protein BDV95DRAFT_172039 [Massariosphaeria phaeospora]